MAETNSHTAVPGEHGPKTFPPFDQQTFASQLVWLVIAFVALYALMAKVALPRVSSILQARRDRIAGDLAEAERHRQESEAAGAAYEKALADARNRAQAIANETRDKLMSEAETNRKALESKLNTQLADAEKTIAATKASAMNNVRGVAVDATKAIVERLIGTAPADGAVAQAVENALKR
ncbi:MAG: F0F1 ATP synthase subunit B [Variibacter sp.]